MREKHWLAVAFPLLSLQGCTDTATFVTATNIGIAASVNTEQVNIGYGRTELFQGPTTRM